MSASDTASTAERATSAVSASYIASSAERTSSAVAAITAKRAASAVSSVMPERAASAMMVDGGAGRAVAYPAAMAEMTIGRRSVETMLARAAMMTEVAAIPAVQHAEV